MTIIIPDERDLESGIVTLSIIVWFQKISIPPQRRELEIPEGWGGGGGGVKGPGNSGEEGGLLVNSRFQMVKFDAMQIVSKSFLTYSENLLHRKNSSLSFRYMTNNNFICIPIYIDGIAFSVNIEKKEKKRKKNK